MRPRSFPGFSGRRDRAPLLSSTGSLFYRRRSSSLLCSHAAAIAPPLQPPPVPLLSAPLLSQRPPLLLLAFPLPLPLLSPLHRQSSASDRPPQASASHIDGRRRRRVGNRTATDIVPIRPRPSIRDDVPGPRNAGSTPFPVTMVNHSCKLISADMHMKALYQACDTMRLKKEGLMQMR